jgi:TldD protein
MRFRPDPALLRKAAAALVSRPGDYGDLFLETVEQAEIRRDERGGRQAILGGWTGAATRVLGASGTRHRAVGGREALEGLGATGKLDTGAPNGETPPSPMAAPADPDAHAARTAALTRYIDLLESAIGKAAPAGDSGASMLARAELRSQEIVVATSEGEVAGDRRAWASFAVRVGRPGRSGATLWASVGGGARDPERLAAVHPPAAVAARIAEALDEAGAAAPAPLGAMPVILGPGVGGLLIHEACGHGLEGDRALRGRSAFANLLGETVGPEDLTIVDDPTLDGLAGSRPVDDEGWPAAPIVLVDAGRVAGLLLDRATALHAGTAPTGSARRESYRDLPLPRMTNTFVRAGTHSPGEIVAAVPRGLYVAELGAGRVDTATAEFSFRVRRGFIVAGGRKVAPVGPCVIAGNGVTVLAGIRMIGVDLRFDPGTGECGKEGQRARAAVGQPTLLVEGLSTLPEGG